MKNNIKIKKISNAVKEIMNVLEIEVTDSTEGTPDRVAKMYVNEMFSSLDPNSLKELDEKMKLFPSDYTSGDMVIIKDIPFTSMCEHHLLPFMGKITVAYVPYKKVIGLSKIPRIVKHFSKKPQLQERLIEEIGEYLLKLTGSCAVFVLAKDTLHTCVSARGIETYCSTDTLYSCGISKVSFKQDFYNRLRG